MIINTFSPAWLILFALAIFIILAISLLCRGKAEKFKVRIMTVYYIFLWIFYFAYKTYIISFDAIHDDFSTCWWNELPFALCQVASMVALPGILKKNGPLLGFCFYVGTICSLMALLMPSEGFYNIPLLSGRSIGFYGFHWLVFGQSILIYAIGLYRPKLKDIPGVMGLLALFALIAHGINFAIRSNFYPEANYFFTFSPENNPILKLLWKYIPIPYIYLLPLILPAGLMFLLLALLLKGKKKTSE